MPQLFAKNIDVVIEGNPILTNITLECPAGVMLALVGPSGCGKSTLLNTLGLIIPPSKGDVFVDGKSTQAWTQKDKELFWRNHAAFVYQDYGVIDDESLAFNITLGGKLSSRSYPSTDSVLEIVGLSGRERQKASVLSGGEKQRLGMARALYKNSSILFLDEPTASLDTGNRDLIIQLLKLIASRGTSVIIATHDDHLAQTCTHRFELSNAASIKCRQNPKESSGIT